MTNTVIKKLRRDLNEMADRVVREREARIIAQGKLERYETDEAENKSTFIGRYNDLEDQVSWLRKILEYIVVPSDKVETIIKVNQQEIEMAEKQQRPPERSNFPINTTRKW